MCASVGRSLDNNHTIGLFSALHGPQRRFREQTCKVVVVENHVTHRLLSSFHSTLTKTPSSPIAPAEKNVWRRHWLRITLDHIFQRRAFKMAQLRTTLDHIFQRRAFKMAELTEA